MLQNQNAFKPTGLGGFNNFSFKDDSRTEKANSYPIESLYNGKLKRSANTLMGLCPFHHEVKPSFAIYPETNTWCCFAGCGGGDAISFYTKLNNVDFKTALEELEKL